MPRLKNTTERQCEGCSQPFKPRSRSTRFCSRKCLSQSPERRQMLRQVRARQLAIEEAMAENLRAKGWQVFSPTACCDRIGVKDGMVYFLEFKPETNISLRQYQKAIRDLVPRMYKVVIGTASEEKVEIRRIEEYRPQGCLGYARARKGIRSKPTSSRFKGVCWDKRNRAWIAKLRVNGQRFHLGSYANEEDAARAYDRAVLDHFGSEGWRNLP